MKKILLLITFVLCFSFTNAISLTYNSPTPTNLSNVSLFEPVVFNVSIDYPSENLTNFVVWKGGSGLQCFQSRTISNQTDCILDIQNLPSGTNTLLRPSFRLSNGTYIYGEYLNLSFYAPPKMTLTPNTADIYINSSGTSRGFKLNWVKNLPATLDDFGGTVTDNGVGYTSMKSNNGSGFTLAFELDSGDFIWQSNVGDSDGTPIIDSNGDFIYINTQSNGVYKLNKSNGNILSNNPICTESMQSMAQSEDMIFDGCTNGTIYAYNKNDLSVAWSISPTYMNEVGMTPLYDNGVVYFGGQLSSSIYEAENNTFAVNATNGNIIWGTNVTSRQYWDEQPSIKDGVFFIISQSGNYLHALNITNGNVIWSSEIYGGSFSQKAIYEDFVVATSTASNFLYVINRTKGNLVCSRRYIGDMYQGVSVIKNGIAFFGTWSGGTTINPFYAVDLNTCQEFWKTSIYHDVFNPPAIANGDLFIKDDSWGLYSFDLGEGNGDWRNLGYDTNGTSYCENCITELKYVEANCNGNDSNFECSIKNNYNEFINVNVWSKESGNYLFEMSPLELASLTYNGSFYLGEKQNYTLNFSYKSSVFGQKLPDDICWNLFDDRKCLSDINNISIVNDSTHFGGYSVSSFIDYIVSLIGNWSQDKVNYYNTSEVYNKSEVNSMISGGEDTNDEFCYFRAFTNFNNPSTGSVSQDSYLPSAINVGGFVGSATQGYYTSDYFTDIVGSMIFRSRAGTSANSGFSVRSGDKAYYSNSTTIKFRTALLFQPSVGLEINSNYPSENTLIKAGFMDGFTLTSTTLRDGDILFVIENGTINGVTRQGGVITYTNSNLTANSTFFFDKWYVFEININMSQNLANFVVYNSTGSVLMNETIVNNHGGTLMSWGVKSIAVPITTYSTVINHINFIDMKTNKLSRFGLC